MGLLERIQSPEDVKTAIRGATAPVLAAEIRERIISADLAERRSHVGPNLGVVELTIGLHRVFNTPKDRFVFDVSHQGYVHKLLTGRNGAAFDKIRQCDGLSGFLNRSESEHDAFGAGHAGTALSAALGMATARDKRGSDEHVVALCGDAAFHLWHHHGSAQQRRHLDQAPDHHSQRQQMVDRQERRRAAALLQRADHQPSLQPPERRFRVAAAESPRRRNMIQFGSKWKKETKDFFVPSSLFEKFNVRYIGPIDGHDQKQVEHYLEFAKQASSQ